jgi:hypothetical protein
MPLATKNGAIIVKDGLLAENCGCCNGWYCCPSVVACPNLLKISAELSAPDITGIYTLEGATCDSSATISRTTVKILHASVFSGSYDLTNVSATANSSSFEKRFASDSVGCSGALVAVTTYGLSSFDIVLVCNEYHWQKQVVSSSASYPKSLSQMQCAQSGTTLDNCTDQEYYGRSTRTAAYRFSIPINLSCLSSAQQYDIQMGVGVGVPFFLVNASDAAGRVIRGGTTNRTYSGGDTIFVKLTFSVA